MRENHYDILGLTPNATQSEIQKAWLKASRIHHPDMQTGNAAIFRLAEAAYVILGKPEARAEYDRRLNQPLDRPVETVTPCETPATVKPTTPAAADAPGARDVPQRFTPGLPAGDGFYWWPNSSAVEDADFVDQNDANLWHRVPHGVHLIMDRKLNEARRKLNPTKRFIFWRSRR